jgi:copper chaperone CopZ
LKIEGMGCQACEAEVNQVLFKLSGVIDASTSYEKGEAKVKYDKTKNSIHNLAATIEKETGYKTSSKK